MSGIRALPIAQRFADAAMRRRDARLALVACLALLSASCQSGYVIDQGIGQISRRLAQRPVDDPELLASLDEAQRYKLDCVPRVLEFCREELGLDPGDSYRTYLDTGGAPVSHIVLGAHPLGLVPHLWCFPFVGCVPYKGYFDVDDARIEALRLRRSGLDVVLLPVGAYSTLGWFRDPIVSTMLDDPLPSFVELLIHETVHRTLYVPDKTTWNESLATHIAREGTRIFFEQCPELARDDELDAYRRRNRLGDKDRELVERLDDDLRRLYSDDSLSADEIVDRKAEIFRTARRARARLWNNPRVMLPASNAYVLASSNYQRLLPFFRNLEQRCGGHPRLLMAYLRELPDPASVFLDNESLDSEKTLSGEEEENGARTDDAPEGSEEDDASERIRP